MNPSILNDYDICSVLKAVYVNSQGTIGIHSAEVKIPRSYKEAVKSDFSHEWKAAMDKEITAPKDKEVLCMILAADIPEGQRPIHTMWVYDLKTDHLGYVA